MLYVGQARYPFVIIITHAIMRLQISSYNRKERYIALMLFVATFLLVVLSMCGYVKGSHIYVRKNNKFVPYSFV